MKQNVAQLTERNHHLEDMLTAIVKHHVRNFFIVQSIFNG